MAAGAARAAAASRGARAAARQGEDRADGGGQGHGGGDPDADGHRGDERAVRGADQLGAAHAAECRPTASAAAMELLARSVTRCGRRAGGSVLPSRDRDRAADRLPTMAMPRAPPTSRIVSLTALPAPAWCAGTVVMMVGLAGAMTRPMPAPMMATATASGG